MGNRQRKHVKVVLMAPCGECPKGKCDRCTLCIYFSKFTSMQK